LLCTLAAQAHASRACDDRALQRALRRRLPTELRRPPGTHPVPTGQLVPTLDGLKRVFAFFNFLVQVRRCKFTLHRLRTSVYSYAGAH
jgi:hypothetical protein